MLKMRLVNRYASNRPISCGAMWNFNVGRSFTTVLWSTTNFLATSSPSSTTILNVRPYFFQKNPESLFAIVALWLKTVLFVILHQTTPQAFSNPCIQRYPGSPFQRRMNSTFSKRFVNGSSQLEATSPPCDCSMRWGSLNSATSSSRRFAESPMSLWKSITKFWTGVVSW